MLKQGMDMIFSVNISRIKKKKTLKDYSTGPAWLSNLSSINELTPPEINANWCMPPAPRIWIISTPQNTNALPTPHNANYFHALPENTLAPHPSPTITKTIWPTPPLPDPHNF